MTWWYLFNGLLILLQINQTLGSDYRVYPTKAHSESLTDKAELNISITETGGLSLFINLKEDIHGLYTTVNLALDVNNNDEYDFVLVKRTIDCCKLFKDPTYEPVIQFMYKILLSSGHFPTNCPIKKNVYYVDDMKIDSGKLPQIISEKKAFLTVKHLSKEKSKFKVLAYYQVYFAVEKINTKSNVSKTALLADP